jgi:DNA end-binding protein Ku
MARAMWRGAIQFGLVTIPVRMYLATESRGGLSFNLLHEEDLQRIQMKVHCPEHGEISRSETVRGYEWSKGRYVVIEESDLDAVPLRTVRAIEIEQFVPARRDPSSPTFVKQAYYLEPEPVGRKAFALLKRVLADSALQAVCKIVLKDRELLAALDPFGPTMLLSTLYWPDEVRDLGELDLPEDDADFKPAELAMARQLVEALTGEFEPERFRDEYREALMRIIEAKVAGEPVEAPAPQPEPSQLADLMAVLEASVAEARRSREAASGPADGKKAATAGRAAGRGRATPKSAGAKAEEPTSVAEARRARGSASRSAASRPASSGERAATKARAGAAAKPGASTRKARASEGSAGASEAAPARRRKSA